MRSKRLLAISCILPVLAVVSCGPAAPKATDPAAVPRAVGSALVDWRLFGLADKQPDGTTMHETLAHEIHGIHGTVYSGGFAPDLEWYEFELSGLLESELRAKLEGSQTVEKPEQFSPERPAPVWWPEDWPAGTRFYRKGHDWIILLEAGTRAWLVRTRS